MKLIDILVEELPKRGGWPEGAARLAQDPDGDIQMLSNRHAYLVSVGWTGDGRIDCYAQYAARKLEPLASDYATAIITREQYEAALAAKNDGWIEWGGGKCPVEKGALIDVKWRDGKVDTEIPAKIRCPSRDRQAIIWHHAGHELDIIAYRLHKPREAVQDKVDDEADLNECIGHDVVPFWNGEGQTPPVGCMCESSWAGDEWQPCKILFTSDQFVVVKLKGSGMEDAYNIGDVTFRAIRPEADRKRDIATQSMNSVWREIAGKEVNGKLLGIYEVIYDAIAAGKIPGVKLEV